MRLPVHAVAEASYHVCDPCAAVRRAAAQVRGIISCQLSVVSFQLSAISYQLPLIIFTLLLFPLGLQLKADCECWELSVINHAFCSGSAC